MTEIIKDQKFLKDHPNAKTVQHSFSMLLRGGHSDLSLGKVVEERGVYIVCKVVDKNPIPIYIGQGKDMNDRLSNHDKYEEFLKACNKRSPRYYTLRTSEILTNLRLDWVEAAVITIFEDSVMDAKLINSQHKDSYGYKTADVSVSWDPESINSGESLPSFFKNKSKFRVYADCVDAKGCT